MGIRDAGFTRGEPIPQDNTKFVRFHDEKDGSWYKELSIGLSPSCLEGPGNITTCRFDNGRQCNRVLECLSRYWTENAKESDRMLQCVTTIHFPVSFCKNCASMKLAGAVERVAQALQPEEQSMLGMIDELMKRKAAIEREHNCDSHAQDGCSECPGKSGCPGNPENISKKKK